MVARRSPQTERIVGLINFLSVDDAGNGVTLSELARRLGVSMATCYPMLEALTDSGFLVRHPTRKTFHLGPALVTAGVAAAKQDPRRAMAREAMIQLGEELNLTSWLYSLEETHFRVVDQAWHSRTVTPIMRVGERIGFRPPSGAGLVAWANERQVARWLDQVSIGEDERKAYHDRLAEVREAGYAVSLEETPLDQLRLLVTQLTNAATPTERSHLVDLLVSRPTLGSQSILTHPDPKREYAVQAIDAPIFDDAGQPTFALGLTNLPIMKGSRVKDLAHRVRDAVAKINKPS